MFESRGWGGTIAPSPDDSSIHSQHVAGWWKKDGFNSASPYIQLDFPKHENADGSYCLIPSNNYYIWYAEDYSGMEGGDNHGTTVDDVYVYALVPDDTTVTTTTATTTTATTTTTITTTISTTTVTTIREDNNKISDRVDAKADTADVTAMEQRLEAKIDKLTQKLKDQEAAHQEEVREELLACSVFFLSLALALSLSLSLSLSTTAFTALILLSTLFPVSIASKNLTLLRLQLGLPCSLPTPPFY